MKLPSIQFQPAVEDENVSVVVLITVLTSFLQSYLDKIRKEEKKAVYAMNR
jgi:hypothetical protein